MCIVNVSLLQIMAINTIVYRKVPVMVGSGGWFLLLIGDTFKDMLNSVE